MPAYLQFYELESSPFEDPSRSTLVLGTKALRDALSAIRSGLEEGTTRICVNGQAGLGKTSLARALPKLLEGRIRTAVILDPTRSWDALRSSIARQWRLAEGGLARSNLVALSSRDRLVVVLDRAEAATTEILDHLDVLLSYRGPNEEPVVQSVLFANLATHSKSEPAPLIWWLDQINTLELQFAPLPSTGVGSYIEKHLQRAGWSESSLFSSDATHAIHGYTKGVPGEIDRVCERLLVEAATRNLRQIEVGFVHEILGDTVEPEADPFGSEFEDLVHEAEFEGADDHNDARSHEDCEREPEQDAKEIQDPATASLIELEAHLSELPTEQELREIRSGGLLGIARMAAIWIIALVIGSMFFLWLVRGKTEPDPSDTVASIPREIPDSLLNPTLFATPEGLSAGTSARPVVARLRGPVRETDPDSEIPTQPGEPARDRRPSTPPAAIQP